MRYATFFVYVILIWVSFLVIKMTIQCLKEKEQRKVALFSVTTSYLYIFFSTYYKENPFALFDNLMMLKSNLSLSILAGVIATLVLIRMQSEKNLTLLFFEVMATTFLFAPGVFLSFLSEETLLATIAKLGSMGLIYTFYNYEKNKGLKQPKTFFQKKQKEPSSNSQNEKVGNVINLSSKKRKTP